MGNSSSANTNGNNTNEDNDEKTSNNDGESVILHVYKPSADADTGFGMVYHSGVEVNIF